MTSYARILSAFFVITLLAACGGQNGTLPNARSDAGSTGYLRATLFVPPPNKQSAAEIGYLRSMQAKTRTSARKPQFLSGNTTELDFVLNSNNGSPASAADQSAFDFVIYTSNSSSCSGTPSTGYTCSVTAPAPVGNDTYKIYSRQCSVSGTGTNTSCASVNGTLTLLGMTFATVNVVYDQIVVAAFTLSPVVASIDWAPVTYAKENTANNTLPNSLWLTQPNGSNIPNYNPSPTPGSYSCAYNTGLGAANGCYEPVAQGVSLAYGEVLEARDASGALIVGASSGGTVYQTPVYLDSSGNVVTISWSCKDNVIGGKSLTWETGGGPYSNNANAPHANPYFNSPVANPSADPDGGNTTDGNGNPVTAVGNNGIEMNWDGVDQPLLGSPDYCSASTSNGLSTSTADFYVGLGEGGVTVNPTPAPTPDAAVYIGANDTSAQSNPELEEFNQGAFGQGAPSIISGLPTYPAEPNCPNANCGMVSGLTFDNNGNLWTHVYLDDQGVQLPSYLVEYSGRPGVGALPLRTITIPAGSVNNQSLAIDDSGNVYMTGGTTIHAVQEFSINSGGSATLVNTIDGSNTQLIWPKKMVVDSAGDLWVLDGYQGPQPKVFEFAPGASGNVAPTHSYFGLQWYANCNIPLAAGGASSPPPNTAFQSGSFGWGMVFDPNGNLFVGVTTIDDVGQASYVMELPKGFTSSTCPTHIFSPSTYSPLDTVGLAVDDNGFLYVGVNHVGNSRTPSGAGVSVYSTAATDGSNGLATPLGTYISPSGVVGFPTGGLAIYANSGWHSGD